MLVNSFLQKHDVDTRSFAHVCSLLVTKEIPGSFYLFQELALAVNSINRVRAAPSSRNLNIIPVNPCSVSKAAKNLLYKLTFFILLQRCKPVKFYFACLGSQLDRVAKIILSEKSLTSDLTRFFMNSFSMLISSDC